MADTPTFKDIPIKYFARRGNRTTQLIWNDAEEDSVKGRFSWYPIQTAEPVFISEIRFHATGYGDRSEIEAKLVDPFGTKFDDRGSFRNGICTLKPASFVSTLLFRPRGGVLSFGSKTIDKIEILGFTKDEFYNFEKAVSGFDDRDAEITSRENSITQKEAAANQRLAQLKTQTSAAEKAYDAAVVDKNDAEEALQATQTKVTAVQTQLTQFQEKVKDAQQELRATNDERREINEELGKERRELVRVRDEIRLFPVEIAEFVREGRRNIALYCFASLPFICIIIWVVYSLFGSAVDLTQLWRVEEGVDLWTIFLTRVPFAVVCIAILEVCGRVIARLLSEVVRITRQRLSLSKISIIARDVTKAAAFDAELTDKETFDAEVALKMAMMREHMKEDLGEEFEFKPTLIQDLVRGATKVLPGGKG